MNYIRPPTLERCTEHIVSNLEEPRIVSSSADTAGTTKSVAWSASSWSRLSPSIPRIIRYCEVNDVLRCLSGVNRTLGRLGLAAQVPEVHGWQFRVITG